MLRGTLTAVTMRSAVVVYLAVLFLTLAFEGGYASPGRVKFAVFPSESILHEGHTLTLTCKADGPSQASIDSPSSYEWVKDGKVIPSETGQTLTIEKLSGHDDGDYQCGQPRSDVYREIFHLDVIRGERSPLGETIFYVDKYGSTLLGRTVRLRCYFFGPLGVKHSYVWVKDGKVIPGATERDIHFQSLSSSDSGDYQCADPSMDVPRRNYHLQVITQIPRPDIFKDRDPAFGHPFSLNCLILTGYSTTADTVYTWYKDSTEIKGQTGQVLWFDNVTEADTGKYTCTARDGPMDTTSHHSEVFNMMPHMTPEVSIRPSNPDSVVKGIQGENMSLTCAVVKAYPRVPYNGYSWTFLPSHHGPVQVLPLTKNTLLLDPLRRNHSGQYTCQARNDQDSQPLTLIGKASVTLDVVYLENIFLTPDQLVNEGDQVTLTCTVESHPTAHLAWFVNGQEVRHVLDNQDHYFIRSAACWDNANYTCTASNADIPNLTKNATTHLVIQCSEDVQQIAPNSDTILTDVAAPLDFTLHDKKTTIVVVHPSGQDMVIVHPNCSFLVSSAFLLRCKHPHCNPKHRRFFFTLIKVMESDEGNYSCVKEGKQRKQIPNCGQKLVLKRQVSDGIWQEKQMWLGIAVTITIVVMVTGGLLVFKQRYNFFYWIKILLGKRTEGNFQSESIDVSRTFESLYEKGKVYIIPKAAPAGQQPPADDGETETESTTPLLAQHSHSLDGVDEQLEFAVLDLVRFTLQQHTSDNDPPSFVLHNTNICKNEKIILILNRKLGVVLMIVKTMKESMHSSFTKKAVNCLIEIRKAVRKKLQGLVKPEAVTAVLALPDMSKNDKTDVSDHLESPTDVEMLFGKNTHDFQQWTEHLAERGDSQVWDLSTAGVNSPDIAFKVATSKFLTLVGGSHPGESFPLPPTIQSQLLSPAQLEVRDSPAKLLHMWGPPYERKTMLLIHRTIKWLADGKAVVAVVARDIVEAMIIQYQGEHPKLRISHTPEEMETALEELKTSFPDVEICVITGILHRPGVLQSLLEAVKSKQVSAALSMFMENLPKLDPDLSAECYRLGWESVHLPQQIRHTEDAGSLLTLLKTGPSDQKPASGSSYVHSQEKVNWKAVDHCLHLNIISTVSCDHCKEELIPSLPSSRQDPQWKDWIAFHTGNPHLLTDLQSLCSRLQRLGVPAVPANKHDGKAVASLPAAGLDIEQKVSLLWVFAKLGVKKRGVLVVHCDDRDNRPECQSERDRYRRLVEHRKQWIQATLSSTGQVILLLLTPSPARSLLNLPDPGVQ